MLLGHLIACAAPKGGLSKKGKNRKAGQRAYKGPVMDAMTSLAITSALRQVDLSARESAFYDPREAQNRKKEDVSAATSILRSWMRTQGLRPLDVFQAWDTSGDFGLTRKELGAGFELFGLVLSNDLLTLVFDSIATGYHLAYDELREWLEGTSKSHLSDEQREHEAAIFIQKCIRGRLHRLHAQRTLVKNQGNKEREAHRVPSWSGS